jgi:hypothetical protein
VGLTLAEHLEVPLRERNVLLSSAGFAPAFGHRPLDAPEMTAVRPAVDQVLAGHEPYPAVALDRTWNVLSMNTAALVLIDGVADWLLEEPNAYRIGLHPQGLAPPAAVTVAELAIESFFPHDEQTARRLKEIAEGVATHA